jgi:hybrid cluster-associated redox disulfide protein
MESITKDSTITDVLRGYPSLVGVFISSGLPCLVCGEPFWGTVEELAQKHGVDVDKLVKQLNEKKREIDEKL